MAPHDETVHPFLPFLLAPIFPPAKNNASRHPALKYPGQNRPVVAGGLEIPDFRYVGLILDSLIT
jgi:hypothetical protein